MNEQTVLLNINPPLKLIHPNRVHFQNNKKTPNVNPKLRYTILLTHLRITT
jgi:hypothetical protein